MFSSDGSVYQGFVPSIYGPGRFRNRRGLSCEKVVQHGGTNADIARRQAKYTDVWIDLLLFAFICFCGK